MSLLFYIRNVSTSSINHSIISQRSAFNECSPERLFSPLPVSRWRWKRDTHEKLECRRPFFKVCLVVDGRQGFIGRAASLGVDSVDIWFRLLGCDRNSSWIPVDWNTRETYGWLILIPAVGLYGTFKKSVSQLRRRRFGLGNGFQRLPTLLLLLLLLLGFLLLWDFQSTKIFFCFSTHSN